MTHPNPYNDHRADLADTDFLGLVPRAGRFRHEAQPEDWRPTSRAEWLVETRRGTVCAFTAWYRPGVGYVWSEGRAEKVWYAARHVWLDRKAGVVRKEGLSRPFDSMTEAMDSLTLIQSPPDRATLNTHGGE